MLRLIAEAKLPSRLQQAPLKFASVAGTGTTFDPLNLDQLQQEPSGCQRRRSARYCARSSPSLDKEKDAKKTNDCGRKKPSAQEPTKEKRKLSVKDRLGKRGEAARYGCRSLSLRARSAAAAGARGRPSLDPSLVLPIRGNVTQAALLRLNNNGLTGLLRTRRRRQKRARSQLAKKRRP